MEQKEKRKSWMSTWWGILLIIFISYISLIIIVGTIQFLDENSSNEIKNLKNFQISNEEIRKKAVSIDYNNLFRDNEYYVGNYVKYEGQVIQTIKSNNGYDFRVAITKDTNEHTNEMIYSDIIYLRYNENKRFLEEDIIYFYGEVKGLITYESILGQEIEIPAIMASEINLIENIS